MSPDNPLNKVSADEPAFPPATDTASVMANKPTVDADNETDTSFQQSQQAQPLSTYDQPSHTDPVIGAQPPVQAKRSKKPLIIGIVAAVAVVLLGGYSAYALWWNNSDKVVGDALSSVLDLSNLTTKGTASFTGENTGTFTASFDTATLDKKTQADVGVDYKQGGVSVALGASMVVDDKTMYVKAKDLEQTLKAFTGGQPELVDMFSPLLSKIDNKWVVITPEDLNKLRDGEEDSDKELTCVQNVLVGIQSNKSQQDELKSAYEKNRFIVVKESKGIESVDGKQSNHYVLGLDESKSKSFGTALKQTSVFKAVDACVKDDLAKEADDKSKEAADSKTTTVVELWVDIWSHKPTKMKLTADSAEQKTKTVIESTFGFGSVKSVAVPKADTTVKDIEAEFNKLQGEMTVPTSYSASDL